MIENTYKSKNAINRLSESTGQSRRALLNMTTKYDAESLAKQIRKYFESNKEAIEVLIYKGKRQIIVDRNFANNKNFIGQFRKDWNKQK